MVKKIMSMLLAVVLLFSIAPLHLYDTAWAAASQRSASTSRSYPTLAASDTWYKGSTAKSDITEITLMNSGKPSGTVAESWDASAAQDGSITAYIVGTKLTLVGNGSGKIMANPDSSYAFAVRGLLTVSSFVNVTTINGLNLLDTSKVTNMSHMFAYCPVLTSLDLSNFDTTNVTDMGSMFYSCDALTGLNVSSFNTANVTDMFHMFGACHALTSLNLSNFDTTNVTDMSHMFARSDALTGLYVSSFNTANVTDMTSMFYGCSALTSLDLSDWNTSNVVTMNGMFSGCSALTGLDLSDWNTSNVVTMGNTFAGCSALTSLDLSGWNTSNVEGMLSMFKGCNKLETVVLGKNFKFVAYLNDTHLLPTPSSTYISGADGKWYDTTTGTGYTPAQLAKVTRTETRTYSAVSNIILDAPVVTFGHSASSGKPQLTWNAVAGATSYEVYRSTSQFGTYSLLGTTAATSYTNTGAVAGTTYYYKVKAICGNGASAYSNVVSGQAKALLPATVPVVTVGHSSSSGKPQLTWKPVTGAISYKVYRAISKAGTYELINTVKATSYTNTYAAPGVTYYYKVEALNGANRVLGVSAIVEGKVAPVLTVGYSTVSGKPQLAWKAIPGATEYRVYRSEKRDSGYTLINKTTAATYVNTGARANATYFYKVAAVKGTAVSDYSNIVTAAPHK